MIFSPAKNAEIKKKEVKFRAFRGQIFLNIYGSQKPKFLKLWVHALACSGEREARRGWQTKVWTRNSPARLIIKT